VLKATAYLEVMKRSVQETEKGGVVCVVDQIKHTEKVKIFEDIKKFSIAQPRKPLSAFSGGDRAVIKVSDGVPVESLNVSAGGSEVFFRSEKFNLSSSGSGPINVRTENSIGSENYSTGSSVLKELEASDCRIEVTSLSGLKKEYDCDVEELEEFNLSLGVEDRFVKDDSWYVNVSVRAVGAEGGVGARVSLSGVEKSLVLSDSGRYLVFPLDEPGFLKVDAGERFERSASLYVTRRRPEVLISFVLIVFLSSLFLLGVFRNN
jgi:hypothetical protein